VSGPERGPGVLRSPPFPASSGGSTGSYGRAVDAPEVPVDPALAVQTYLEGLKHPIPCSVAAPSVEPLVDRLPGAIALRQVAPRGARAQEPEYGVEHCSQVASGPPTRRGRWEQIFQRCPLLIRQFVSSHAPSSERGLDLSPTLVPKSKGALQRFFRQSLDGTQCLCAAHVHEWFDDAVGLTGDWREAGPVYVIPQRALCGVSNCNLLAAGRCISADRTVWDVTRAIPTCAVTGEAAGTASALAIQQSASDVRRLSVRVLQRQLQSRGVLLDPSLVKPSSGQDDTGEDVAPNETDGGDVL